MIKTWKRVCAAFTCTAMLAATLPLHTASADSILLTPYGGINIQVVDKDGHILTGAQMEIQDKAKQVDSTWESGAEQHAVHHNSHTEAESETLVSIPQAVYKPYLNGCVLSQTSFYRMDGSLVSDSLTPRLQYDTEYSVALRYVPKTLPVDLTVPANQVYLNVDSAWSAKTMTSTLSLANTDLSWTLQNLAGTQTAYAAPTGNYATHVDIQKSDGTSASDGTTVTVCETPKTYCKKTFRLHDVSPYFFNENGTYVNPQDGSTYDFGKDVAAENRSGVLYLVSGSVINAVIPDSEGYVTAYVIRDTSSCVFQAALTTPGGKSAPLYIFDEVRIGVHTMPKYPGFNIVNLLPEEVYTIHQQTPPLGYKRAEDVVVTLASLWDYQQIKVVNERCDPGDVNMNGVVDTDDAVLILKAYTITLMQKPLPFTELEQSFADINSDKKIDTDDAVTVLKNYTQSLL